MFVKLGLLKSSSSTEEESEEDVAEEGEDDDEEDEEETEITGYFVKKERFRLLEPIFHRHLFDVTFEFGFNVKDDNKTVEVFHKGIHFSGFWPFYFVFRAHGLYFWLAASHYINNPVFGNEELEEQSVRYRRNVPAAVVTEILFDLTEDIRQAREWAKANAKSTREHDETLEEVKELLLKAGYSNVDAIEVNGKGIKLNFKDDARSQTTIRRAMTVAQVFPADSGTVKLSRKRTLKDYSNRAAEKGFLFDLTSDVRAAKEFEKEHNETHEEETGKAKGLDLQLLKRNSLIDLKRPGVKEESFSY